MATPAMNPMAARSRRRRLPPDPIRGRLSDELRERLAFLIAHDPMAVRRDARSLPSRKAGVGLEAAELAAAGATAGPAAHLPHRRLSNAGTLATRNAVLRWCSDRPASVAA